MTRTTPHSGVRGASRCLALAVLTLAFALGAATETLTINIVGEGSTSPTVGDTEYANGETATLSAFPNIGWVFSGWQGDLTGNTNPVAVTMDADNEIAAVFTENPAEGERTPALHSADTNSDYEIGLSELLRTIQFFAASDYTFQSGTEDGYAPGTAGTTQCPRHTADYQAPAYAFNLAELLRVVQLYRTGYRACTESPGPDGFCAGA